MRESSSRRDLCARTYLAGQLPCAVPPDSTAAADAAAGRTRRSRHVRRGASAARLPAVAAQPHAAGAAASHRARRARPARGGHGAVVCRRALLRERAREHPHARFDPRSPLDGGKRTRAGYPTCECVIPRDAQASSEYANAKLALVMHSSELNRRLGANRSVSHSVNPGVMLGDFHRSDPAPARTSSQSMRSMIMGYLPPVWIMRKLYGLVFTN
eukprot:7103876-Prymnesium_polylepis.1